MNKDILIVAQYTQAPGEYENDRFRYLAERIQESRGDVAVEVVTMSFSHHKKMQRNVTEDMLKAWPYDMTFIKVPGYKKNVSLSRFRNTHAMGKGLAEYLKKRKKPDVIYCAVPSLDAGYEAAKYARDNKIPFYIDVQDLWPEAFQLAFRVPVLSDLIFSPMKQKADFIYSAADKIYSVSQTYADRAMRVNTKCSNPEVVFLGTDLGDIDTYIQAGKAHRARNRNNNKITVAYVGTLGSSYDLTSVIDALAILHEKSEISFKFLIMGDGPLYEKFKNHAGSAKIDAEFTGRLPYTEMMQRLSACDIAVNPIQGGAAQSIINKHADYAAAGLPVINTQESNEYRSLLERFKAGFNCMNGNPVEIAERLEELACDYDLREFMGNNSSKMANDCFNRNVTYKTIIQALVDETM